MEGRQGLLMVTSLAKSHLLKKICQKYSAENTRHAEVLGEGNIFSSSPPSYFNVVVDQMCYTYATFVNKSLGDGGEKVDLSNTLCGVVNWVEFNIYICFCIFNIFPTST